MSKPIDLITKIFANILAEDWLREHQERRAAAQSEGAVDVIKAAAKARAGGSKPSNKS